MLRSFPAINTYKARLRHSLSKAITVEYVNYQQDLNAKLRAIQNSIKMMEYSLKLLFLYLNGEIDIST